MAKYILLTQKCGGIISCDICPLKNECSAENAEADDLCERLGIAKDEVITEFLKTE